MEGLLSTGPTPSSLYKPSKVVCVFNFQIYHRKFFCTSAVNYEFRPVHFNDINHHQDNILDTSFVVDFSHGLLMKVLLLVLLTFQYFFHSVN